MNIIESFCLHHVEFYLFVLKKQEGGTFFLIGRACPNASRREPKIRSFLVEKERNEA